MSRSSPSSWSEGGCCLQVEKGPARAGRALLAVENLDVRDGRGALRVRDVSFTVRAGEIVGIAGVAGNGQSELLETLAGLRPAAGGRIVLAGEPVDADGRLRRRRGIAHVPEDRRRMGLVMPFEARESAILGYDDDALYRRAALLDWNAVSRDTAQMMNAFDVRPADPRRSTAAFSGGNQQKLVLAREIERDPLVLLVGQPTRGVDIGAIEFIHRRLVAMRDAGKAVLLVSSELDEIMGLSDRILVMFGGAVVGEFPAERATERTLGLLMAGCRHRERGHPRVVSTVASGPAAGLPRWAVLVLLPVLNVLVAFAVSGLIVLLIGESPWDAVRILVWGAFGFGEAIGYTLFYATNFIFTALAVAVAFHCGLFNIGGEGQASIGGLGMALVCLHLDFLPFALIAPAAILGAALFGAAWAFVPAWLQAYRGSHVVITTIMFNFIAASVMVWLLVNVMSRPGSMEPESRDFAPHARLPLLHETLGAAGIDIAASPLNLSFLWALVCCAGVWLFIWHTRAGYRLRTVGASPPAALYGGISPPRQVVVAMLVSGALAGFMSLNELMGVQHRLVLEFTAGYGFAGIAVALMGRCHPAGIVLASILFGALYQGGAELSFEIPRITRDMVVVIQGLVILFAGALGYLFVPALRATLPRRAGG